MRGIKRDHQDAAASLVIIQSLSYQGRHPPQQLAAMVARSNVLYDDATLFVESGANQHIPPGITNLTNSEPYNGEEKVAIVNGIPGPPSRNAQVPSLSSLPSTSTVNLEQEPSTSFLNV
ncbi:uncharacterized protein [Typha latifolia]|uniref:uncharacterized protein isoform X2 n=1 Tax=Typha latifolia TaxID=4733 RepID=UPI003C2E1C31